MLVKDCTEVTKMKGQNGKIKPGLMITKILLDHTYMVFAHDTESPSKLDCVETEILRASEEGPVGSTHLS